MTQLFRPRPGQPGYLPPGDPVTIGLIGLQVVGTLSSAGAQMAQGRAAAQWGAWNKAIFDQQAEQRIAEANARAGIIEREGARKMGQTKAAFGAAGVVLEGTPLDVLADQASEIELQKQLAIYQGRTEALTLQQRGFLAATGGAMAQDAANTAAGTTLLTGFAKAGANAYNAYKTPAGGGTPGTTGPSIAQWYS